jgi:hypothetical protein
MMMVAGSVLASFILAPMIVLFGSGLAEPLAPATDLIRDMSPDDVWATTSSTSAPARSPPAASSPWCERCRRS